MAAVTLKASKAALKEALRGVAGDKRGALTKLEREVLAELREAGHAKTSSFVSIRVHKKASELVAPPREDDSLPASAASVAEATP
jgi:hypothetical protein